MRSNSLSSYVGEPCLKAPPPWTLSSTRRIRSVATCATSPRPGVHARGARACGASGNPYARGQAMIVEQVAAIVASPPLVRTVSGTARG